MFEQLNAILTQQDWVCLHEPMDYEMYCGVHRDPCHYIIKQQGKHYVVAVASRRDRSVVLDALASDIPVWIKASTSDAVRHHLPEEQMENHDEWFSHWAALKNALDSYTEPAVDTESQPAASATEMPVVGPVPFTIVKTDNPTMEFWRKQLEIMRGQTAA